MKMDVADFTDKTLELNFLEYEKAMLRIFWR